MSASTQQQAERQGFFKRLRARLNKGDSWLTYDLAELVPGAPEAVLLDPGASLVIAHDGTNHQPFSTVDLTGADYEAFVESDDDDVRISKKGEYMYVHVEENAGYADSENVQMKFPIPVLTALVSGDDDELDLMAALDVLAEYEGEDLVTVNDDGTSVRIWVDQKSTQNN